MKKIILPLLIIILALLAVSPVMAGSGGITKGMPEARKIGDKQPLKTGEQAVYKGKTSDGKEIWTVKIGEPVYIPNTNTKYDCTWKLDTHGRFVAGANVFQATVVNDNVTITKDGKSSKWLPKLTIGDKETKALNVKPVILAVDPVNSNYHNNTLMWDYNNGITRYLRIIEGMVIEYYQIERALDGDLLIDNGLNKDAGFTWHRTAYAYDADKNIVNIGETLLHNIVLSKDVKTVDKITGQSKDVKYPITIDPDTSFTGSSSDGYIHTETIDPSEPWDAFALARVQASGDTVYSSTLVMDINVDDRNTFDVVMNRAYLMFDTSDIPDDVTITDSKLYVKPAYITDGNGAGLYIVNGMSTYPHIPLVVGDWGYTNYGSFTTNYGYVAATSLTAGTYEQVNLSNSTALKEIVNKTGYTKVALIDNSDYTGVGCGTVNTVGVWTYEEGAGYRPYLEVTYSATAPSITADDANNIAEVSARLNATVTDDGGEPCTVRWGYGTTTQTSGNFASYDTVTEWTGADYETGEHPYLDVSSLNSGDTYYYRVQIDNSNSTVTSGEINFTTESSFSAPTNLRAFPSATSVSLSWAKGTGSTNTLIRYSTVTFPTATDEGTELYESTGTVTTHTGLTGGMTIYYSAWGESDSVYTDTYATVAVTTSAFSIDSGDDLEAPSAFTGWFQDPDYTNLSGLEPVYSAVNGVADAFGTPRNTAWQGLILVLAAIIGVAVMTKAGFVGGLITVCIVIALGVAVHVLSSWLILMIIVFGIFGWAMQHKEVGT